MDGHDNNEAEAEKSPKVEDTANRIISSGTWTTSAEGEVLTAPPHAAVDAFGSEDGAEVKYKTMEWWHVGLLMLAETISLGILSLPAAVATLGLFPGLFLIAFLGVLSTYNGYVIGQFKLAFPQVANMADAGRILGGRVLGEILCVGSIAVLVFIMAAHIATFRLMMNVLTNQGACSIIFSFVGLVLSIVCGLPRTMHKTSYLSSLSSISVAIAVLLVMIAVAITRPDTNHIRAFRNPDLTTAMTSTLNIILAYAGHVAFFSFASELRDPRDFKKSVILMQSFSAAFYLVTAVVIYYYAGPSVAAPALTSVNPTVTKAAYGIAIPTIVIAGVVNGHVACKLFYVRWWRSGDAGVMHQRGLRAVGSWVLICGALWVFAWVIAEAVPGFKLLLALVGALFSGWFSFGITGALWLHMNKGRWRESWRKVALAGLNVFVLAMGCVICVLGLYATGVELKRGKGGKPFSCAASTDAGH